MIYDNTIITSKYYRYYFYFYDMKLIICSIEKIAFQKIHTSNYELISN